MESLSGGITMIAKIRNKFGQWSSSRYWADNINDNFYKDVSRFFQGSKPEIFYVGANVGQALRPMKRYMPGASIKCFEPFPANVTRLHRRAKGKNGVEVYPMGVSDRPGELFIVPHDNPTMVRLVGEDSGGLEKTDVTTIDQFCAEHTIDRINILKIDVEGLEMNVLHGAQGMLSRVDCIYLECGINPDNEWHTSLRAVSDLLEPLGFRIARFYEQVPEWPTRQPHLRRADVAFLSPEIYAKH